MRYFGLQTGYCWFGLQPDFSFNKFFKQMLGLFEQLCDFVESTEKKLKACQTEVESSLNLTELLLPAFHTTFALFPK